MRKIILAAAFAALSFIAYSSAAYAHAELMAAEPPVNGTVKSAPTELDLKFSEELNLKFTGIKVTGPDKKEVKTENAMLMDGDKTLMVSVPGALVPRHLQGRVARAIAGWPQDQRSIQLHREAVRAEADAATFPLPERLRASLDDSAG
jgi:methionine-rich copper-binding protein CopC